LAQQKLDMDTYMKMRKLDQAALREETKPLAEERLKSTLILLDISKKEGIQVENSELESESMRTLNELGRMMPPDKAKKMLTNEFMRGMIGNIGADLLVQHTWSYLQAVARGEKEEQPEINEPEKTGNQVTLIETKEKPKKKKTTKKVEKE
jgi:FKBP-type peptidyl-prolyl cis-trans isomerase (trigger factor)